MTYKELLEDYNNLVSSLVFESNFSLYDIENADFYNLLETLEFNNNKNKAKEPQTLFDVF